MYDCGLLPPFYVPFFFKRISHLFHDRGGMPYFPVQVKSGGPKLRRWQATRNRYEINTEHRRDLRPIQRIWENEVNSVSHA